MMKYQVDDDGENVLLCVNDRHVYPMDWECAFEVARFITKRARKLEQIAKRQQIIRAGAMLQRAGWRGAGVTDNPQLQDRIGIEAAHDRDLRRYMPGGVKGQYRIGLGRIIQGPPKEATED